MSNLGSGSLPDTFINAGKPLFSYPISTQETPAHDDQSLQRLLFLPVLYFRLDGPANSASTIPINSNEANSILAMTLPWIKVSGKSWAFARVPLVSVPTMLWSLSHLVTAPALYCCRTGTWARHVLQVMCPTGGTV
jgi:hypothetical protein